MADPAPRRLPPRALAGLFVYPRVLRSGLNRLAKSGVGAQRGTGLDGRRVCIRRPCSGPSWIGVTIGAGAV